MTRVRVESGICGFHSEITAEKKAGKLYAIGIVSDCEMVRAFARDIEELGFLDLFKGFMQNPVYKAAGARLKHVACPVPCAVLKTLEVEAGVCLRKDVTIAFINDKPAVVADVIE